MKERGFVFLDGERKRGKGVKGQRYSFPLFKMQILKQVKVENTPAPE